MLYHFRKDFRPSYRKLGILRSIFPKVPLLGMTATATKRPGRDIIESLGMQKLLETPTDEIFTFRHQPDQIEAKISTEQSWNLYVKA